MEKVLRHKCAKAMRPIMRIMRAIMRSRRPRKVHMRLGSVRRSVKQAFGSVLNCTSVPEASLKRLLKLVASRGFAPRLPVSETGALLIMQRGS